MSIKCPDIASKTKTTLPSPLEKVGMSQIQVPINLAVGSNQAPVMQMAEADAYVNLVDPNAKGIHMSRLFISLQDEFEAENFNLALVKKVLTEFLESHNGLSDQAFLNVRYKHPLKQKSLNSDRSSWRSYPVNFSCSLDQEFNFMVTLQFSVLYSSTCPCSAALSRQALQEKLSQDFEQRKQSDLSLTFAEVHDWVGAAQNIIATPHSQRSKATICIKSSQVDEFDLGSLIKQVEGCLKTPVQSIVKREDEKEFAKLNGQNLMFAEDAARKIKQSLVETSVPSFSVHVSHFESLHAHNAEAYAEHQFS